MLHYTGVPGRQMLNHYMVYKTAKQLETVTKEINRKKDKF